jgi:hypothetical protein
MAGRYTQLIVEKENFPDDLELPAKTRTVISWLCNINTLVQGVQFHPEKCADARWRSDIAELVKALNRDVFVDRRKRLLVPPLEFLYASRWFVDFP